MPAKQLHRFLFLALGALFLLALASCDHLIMPDRIFLLGGDKAEEMVQYRLIFETGDGSAVDDQMVAAGGLAIRPADPFRSEYVFSGWYELANLWDFTSNTVNSDITLEALWTPVVDPYNWADFGTLVAPNYPVPGGVDSAQAWDAAITAINAAPVAGNYVIDITGSFTLPGAGYPNNPQIGPQAGTVVSLRGHNGAVISMENNPLNPSCLLDVEVATVILRNLKLAVDMEPPVHLGDNGKLALKDGAVVCGTRHMDTGIYLGGDDVEVVMEGNSRVYNLENGIFAYSGDTHKITMSGSAQIYGNDWCGINTENVQNVTVTMSGNAQIYGNNARGVLLDATPNGNFTMDGNAQIYGNGQGGVKCSSSSGTFPATFVMTGNAQIHSNQTTNGGGVFLGDYANFYMGGSAQIYGNTGGSGVKVVGSVLVPSTFVMGGNAQIHGNTTAASDSGGGVYLEQVDFYMSGSAQIYGNTTSNQGGGVFVHTGAQFDMSGGVVYGSNEPLGIQNTATSASDGPSVYNKSGNSLAIGVTSITNNDGSDATFRLP